MYRALNGKFKTVFSLESWRARRDIIIAIAYWKMARKRRKTGLLLSMFAGVNLQQRSLHLDTRITFLITTGVRQWNRLPREAHL